MVAPFVPEVTVTTEGYVLVSIGFPGLLDSKDVEAEIVNGQRLSVCSSMQACRFIATSVALALLSISVIKSSLTDSFYKPFFVTRGVGVHCSWDCHRTTAPRPFLW